MKVYGFNSRNVFAIVRGNRLPGYRPTKINRAHTARQAGKRECLRQMEDLG